MAVLEMEKHYSIDTYYVDFKDYLKPSAVLDFCQAIACEHAEKIGAGYQAMLDKGYYWVVLYEQFEVTSRIPRFGDNVIVKTWPKKRSKLEFEREYEITDKNGDSLIKAIANWVIIGAKSRTLERANDVNFAGEYHEGTNYLEKQKRHLGLQTDNFDLVYEHQVTITDLDHNGHVNNARYLDLILNMQDIANYKPFRRVEIAFIHEVKFGEIIRIGHYVDNDFVDCYIGGVDDKTAFEVKLYKEE